MKTPETGKSSILKGCLLAFVILIGLAAIGGFFVYQKLGPVFSDAIQEIDAEVQKKEAELRQVPAGQIHEIQLAELLSAFKNKPEEAKSQYLNQVLHLSGIVSTKDNLANSLPLNLQVDVLQMQTVLGQTTDDNSIICLYSSQQKARFSALKAQEPVSVKARVELDQEDGSLMLSPCIIE